MERSQSSLKNAGMLFLLFLVIILLPIQHATGQNSIGIGTTSPNATLDILRGSAPWGTAAFRGTSNISHFNFGSTEDTYIRGGKAGSHVILNDLPGSGYVGIGTNSPIVPLTFPGTLGNKIALWNDGTANHYGLGVQSGLLQVFTKTVNDDIAFGYGNSNSFFETLRMKGNGILQFPAGLNKKIILYPGSIGDASLGVFPNELRISSDYWGADISFGYDNRSVGFTEKFRMKADGAFLVNGNAGQAGQVLQSNGSGSPTWSSVSNWLFNNLNQINQSSSVTIANSNSAALPGMGPSNLSLNISSTSRLILCQAGDILAFPCVLCSDSYGGIRTTVYKDGNTFYQIDIRGTTNNAQSTWLTNGLTLLTVGPGNYTFYCEGYSISGPDLYITDSKLFIMVVPQ